MNKIEKIEKFVQDMRKVNEIARKSGSLEQLERSIYADIQLNAINMFIRNLKEEEEEE